MENICIGTVEGNTTLDAAKLAQDYRRALRNYEGANGRRQMAEQRVKDACEIAATATVEGFFAERAMEASLRVSEGMARALADCVNATEPRREFHVGDGEMLVVEQLFPGVVAITVEEVKRPAVEICEVALPQAR